MGNTYVGRELRVSALLKEQASVAQEKTDILHDNILALTKIKNKIESNPKSEINKINSLRVQMKEAQSIALSSSIIGSSYTKLLKTNELHVNSNKSNNIPEDILKMVNKISGINFDSTTMEYDPIQKKSRLKGSTAILNMLNENGILDIPSFVEYIDSLIDYNLGLLNFKIDKASEGITEVLVEIANPSQNSERVYKELLKERSGFFTTYLNPYDKMDVYNIISRLSLIIIATSICKSIIDVDVNMYNKIIEKINKTDCKFKNTDEFIYDFYISTYNEKIKPQNFDSEVVNKNTRIRDIEGLNIYLSAQEWFKTKVFNDVQKKQYDDYLTTNIKNMFVYFNDLNKNYISNVGFEAAFLNTLSNSKPNIHIDDFFTNIFRYINELKPKDVEKIDYKYIYENVYGFERNKIIQTAKQQYDEENGLVTKKPLSYKM